MNKERIEFLTDAVFSIVMTLLVIEIRVPEMELDHHLTDLELWKELTHLAPLFLAYFVSFAVLTMYWMSNHALWHFFVKKTDRALMYLNMLFLMLISFIPFNAHFLGEYPNREPAVIFYGVNLLCLGLVSLWMFFHVIKREHLLHSDLSSKTVRQARIRLILTPSFAILGIIVSYVSIPVSLFLFAFPVIFNIIPGTLNTLEKLFKFEI